MFLNERQIFENEKSLFFSVGIEENKTRILTYNSIYLPTYLFQNISVADNYGVFAYSIFLFALTIWWGQVWGDATACPYFHFESLIEGSMQPLEVAVRTLAEVFGGIAIFK